MAENQDIELEGGVLAEGGSSIEEFIEGNQNIIFGILGAVVLAVAIFVGYKKLIVAPKEAEAKKLVYHAQNYFAKDSFNLALNGDGENYGFYDIQDEFGGTSVGKMARYYIGVSELNLGNFDEAISQLSKFNSPDASLQAVAYGALGDAYAESDDLAKAAKEYEKAGATAEYKSIKANYLFRAGVANEVNGDNAAAKKAYEKIADLYPDALLDGLAPAERQIADNARKNLAKVSATLN